MAKNNRERLAGRAIRCQLYGWILFIACALLFIAASIVDRQPLVLAGSIIFLLACLLFLVPLIDTYRNGRDDR